MMDKKFNSFNQQSPEVVEATTKKMGLKRIFKKKKSNLHVCDNKQRDIDREKTKTLDRERNRY